MRVLLMPSSYPPVLRSLLRQADAVTACSQYLLERAVRLESSVASKGHVIHNGIDPTRFRDKTPHSHPRPYVLAYGRLTYTKGFDLLLRAFAEVAPLHPDLDLILAGEREERDRLQGLSLQLGLNGRVVFYGRATPQEVVKLLNGCSLAAVPSRAEPFDIAALEARAAERPLLATRVGGLPEIVGGASLVEPTEQGLAKGLAEQLERSAAAGDGGGRDEGLALDLAWPHVIQRYVDVYDRACDAPDRSGRWAGERTHGFEG